MVVSTVGDAGDCVYLFGILNAIPGGPHDLLIEEKDDLTATGKNEGAPDILLYLIKHLALSQPYIRDCRLASPTDIPHWRSGGFRRAGLHRRTEPLLQAHLSHLNQITGLGLKVDTSRPWLWVQPHPSAKGRVVINRTSRYRNKHFPWAEIVKFYGNRLLFVGLTHEHLEFCDSFGFVEFYPTKVLMEVAQLIAGSELFIGNQSVAFAMAEAMKHPAIQETSLYIPDCVFKRDNVQHVWDGACTLHSVDGTPSLKLPGKGLNIGLVSTMKTPPQPGWQFPGVAPQETFHQCEAIVSGLPSMHGKSRKEIEEAIKQYNLELYPDYYRPKQEGENVKAARLFAGYAS